MTQRTKQGVAASSGQRRCAAKEPAKTPPVFSWQEKKSLHSRFIAMRPAKTLSVVTLYKPLKGMATAHTNEVLKRRDK
jgi:hypothetical protein